MVKPTDPRSVWGKVLLSLRKNGIINVHSICVEVSDIVLNNNDFIINIHKSINYETLKKPQNLSQLLDTFKNLGYNYNVILAFAPEREIKVDKATVLSELLGCEVQKI